MPKPNKTATMDRMAHSLDNYLRAGIQPGSFLTAVLANDLEWAVMTADPYSLGLLKDIVLMVRDKVPVEARGGWDEVNRWCNPPDIKNKQQKETNE